mmetsp:Transcript_27994/g.66497  ORF Transcript_27994/g.66497 Transcript_27994/m.66497 type:complete len:324 (-) Transcript_27994:681-1652(-)
MPQASAPWKARKPMEPTKAPPELPAQLATCRWCWRDLVHLPALCSCRSVAPAHPHCCLESHLWSCRAHLPSAARRLLGFPEPKCCSWQNLGPGSLPLCRMQVCAEHLPPGPPAPRAQPALCLAPRCVTPARLPASLSTPPASDASAHGPVLAGPTKTAARAWNPPGRQAAHSRLPGPLVARRRCRRCHAAGPLILKLARFPWLAWNSKARTTTRDSQLEAPLAPWASHPQKGHPLSPHRSFALPSFVPAPRVCSRSQPSAPSAWRRITPPCWQRGRWEASTPLPAPGPPPARRPARCPCAALRLGPALSKAPRRWSCPSHPGP